MNALLDDVFIYSGSVDSNQILNHMFANRKNSTLSSSITSQQFPRSTTTVLTTTTTAKSMAVSSTRLALNSIIIGVAVGLVLSIIVIVVILVVLFRKRKTRQLAVAESKQVATYGHVEMSVPNYGETRFDL